MDGGSRYRIVVNAASKRCRRQRQMHAHALELNEQRRRAVADESDVEECSHTGESDESSGADWNREEYLVCQNCNQRGRYRANVVSTFGSQGAAYLDHLVFHRVPLPEISFRKKFCLMKRWDLSQLVPVVLCEQCKVALCQAMFDDDEKCECCWPAFVWSLFSNSDMRREHRELLWALVPDVWRPWWLHAV